MMNLENQSKQTMTEGQIKAQKQLEG